MLSSSTLGRLAALCGVLFWLSASLAAAPRTREAWLDGWRFALGDPAGASQASYEAAGWRALSLPHDWSIELPRDEQAPAAGHGGFFATGIGWYRRTFTVPESWRGRVATLEFEGAFMNTTVWVNGVVAGRHLNGHTPFRVDLSPHLRLGAENVVAVRVDNSAQPSARWYNGSGLYRPVWLEVTAPVRVEADSVVATTTRLAADTAEVRVQAAVRNGDGTKRELRIETTVIDPRGKKVGSATRTLKVAAGATAEILETFSLDRPRVWSLETPVLHRVVTRVFATKDLLDEVTTSFGVRTIHFSAERGFELNGRPVELNGGNLHHDNGVLGAAALARAEERKVELMKAAGFNAVRTAHNPPSRAFLDACDRLGLLVIDELYDGWAKAKNKQDYHQHFKAQWADDVAAWVRRDRNHPSVIAWSVGNEMFERGGADGQRIARELAARVREFDATRPVTAGINGLGKSGKWEQLDPLFAAFELAGYNYELTNHRDDHARLPQRVIVAAESYQSEVFANWRIAQEQPYVVGDFVWSALDYLGEAGIGRVYRSDEPALKHWEGSMWPWFGAYCGDLDLTGWRKPVSHYRAIVWDRGEKLHAAVLVPTADGQPWNVTPWSMPPALPSWTWPGQEGKTVTLEVYSRHESVRVELNGQRIGEAPTGLAQEFRAKFEVPYQPGELVITGLERGKPAGKVVLRSAGAPKVLAATTDRVKLAADGQDLAFIVIQSLDALGVPNPAAPVEATIEVSGAGTLAGFGTGDVAAKSNFFDRTIPLHQGRALAVVRAGSAPGAIRVRVTAPGLRPATLTLQVSRQ